MILQELEDLVMMGLTDDDLYPAYRALWGMRTVDVASDLRSEMLATLVFRKKVFSLKGNIEKFIKQNYRLYRELLTMERNLAPEEGKRSYALVYFASTSLGFTLEWLFYWLKKAKEEGSKKAEILLSGMYDINEKVSNGQIEKLSDKTIKNLKYWEAGSLALYADEENNHSLIAKYKRGADDGNPYCAAYLIKELEKQGKHLEALKYYELSLQTNNPDDLFNYALTYIGSIYQRVDYKRGKGLLIKAANAGSAEAAAHLGKSALWGNMYYEEKANFLDAEKYLTLADKLNHDDAGYFLGSMYFGYYDPPISFIDKEKAVAIFERLAMRNQPDALMEIGCLYYNGDVPGYPKEPLTADSYFKRAADHGSIKGAFYYASMIAKNEITNNDHAVPIKYLLRAMSGYSETADDAKECLVDLYREGTYFKKDEDWANIIENYTLPKGKSSTDNHRKILHDFELMYKDFKEKYHRELDFIISKPKINFDKTAFLKYMKLM